jgi:Animal haem peroxidase
MIANFFEGLIAAVFRIVNRLRVWHRLPFPVAVVNLLSLRVDLRWRNLFDTETAPPTPAPPPDFDVRHCRTADGTFNDLSKTWMGMTNARFGRNAPLPQTFGEQPPNLYEPNPRVISRELLARGKFIPAETVNVLLAAWLQFMVHDWLSHGVNDTQSPPWHFPVPVGDDWPTREMTILRTSPDRQRGPKDEGRPATYRNIATHWWDGSQMYGSDLQRQHCVRSSPAAVLLPDGKLSLGETGYLPIDPDASDHDPLQELAAVNGNWWIGLSTMHTLFTREHNSIVDRLRVDYRDKNGEWLFQKARLINAALIVKIHATEWSHALLQSQTLQYSMRGEWWGALGEAYFKAFGRPLRNELLSGIPSSSQEHYAAPFSITEEFTAVYRLHSLIPDDFSFRRHGDDGLILACSFADVMAGGATQVHRKVPFDDVLYSLGTSYPGALELHNYPMHLRRLPENIDKIKTDVAATDILRDRERGVPRYCAFRRMLRMSVPKTFKELTDNEQWQQELEKIYGDVERVDLLIGTLAETKPPGFAISDTSFRIFIVMAARRIKSDRFLTDDYTPEVYTPLGIDWIENNGMREVLLRHAPSLGPTLANVRNCFFPWPKSAS